MERIEGTDLFCHKHYKWFSVFYLQGINENGEKENEDNTKTWSPVAIGNILYLSFRK